MRQDHDPGLGHLFHRVLRPLTPQPALRLRLASELTPQSQPSEAFTLPVIGEIAMLALAIILLRLMPQGITGRFFKNST